MTADNGVLGKLIAEGNAQATVQFVGALTSLMNKKGEPVTEVITTRAAPTDGPGGNPAEVAGEETRRLDESRVYIFLCIKITYHQELAFTLRINFKVRFQDGACNYGQVLYSV